MNKTTITYICTLRCRADLFERYAKFRKDAANVRIYIHLLCELFTPVPLPLTRELCAVVATGARRNENKLKNFHSKPLKSAHGQRQHFGDRIKKQYHCACPTSIVSKTASFSRSLLFQSESTFKYIHKYWIKFMPY